MKRLAKFLFRLLRRIAVAVVVIWTVAWFIFDGELLGSLVSKAVTNSVRGTFHLGRIHVEYLGGLWGLITDRPAKAYGEDYYMLDPDGNVVLRVDGVETEVYLRTLVASTLGMLYKGKFCLTLHFQNARGPRALALITPTRSTWGKTPSEVNIVAAMQGKKQGGPGSELMIQLDGLEIDEVDFGLGFANPQGNPAWYATLNHAKVKASLLYRSNRELESPEGPYFFFQVEPVVANSGMLQMGGVYRFPLEDIKIDHFGSRPPDRGTIGFAGTAKSRAGRVKIDGALTDVFSGAAGVRLDLAAENGAGMLHQLPQPIGRWLGGPATGNVHMEGPFSHVTIVGKLHKVEADIEGMVLHELSAGLRLDCGRLDLTDVSGAAGGGKVDAKLRVQIGDNSRAAPTPAAVKKARREGKDIKRVDDLGCPITSDKPSWRADLTLRHVDPDKIAWVPRSLAPEVAGQLDGSLRLSGSLVDHPEVIEVSQIDATLERRIARLLPRRVRLGGGVRFSSTMVRLLDLSASGEGLHIEVTGSVNPKTLGIDADTTIDATAGNWFPRLYANPQLRVGRLHASGRAEGTLQKPELQLAVDLDDWNYAGRHIGPVAARVTLGQGDLAVHDLHGIIASGQIEGRARFHLFDGGALTRRALDPTLDIEFGMRGGNMRELAGLRMVEGRLAADLRVHGTVAHPTAAGEADISGFAIHGDPYDRAQLRVELADARWRVEDVAIDRRAGGHLTGRASVGPKGALDSELNVAVLPFDAIPGLRKLPWALTGLITAAINARGSTEHPAVSGQVGVDDTMLRKVALGKGGIELTPTAHGFALAGRLWKAFDVTGEVLLEPSTVVHLKVTFADYAVEGLVPELADLAETRGVLSGELTFDYDVASQRMAAGLRLGKIDFVVASVNESELHRRLRVQNDGDVVLRSDGSRLYVDHCELKSAIGTVKVAGVVDRKDSDLEVRGRLGLELVQYFVRGIFEHVHGDAEASIKVLGALNRPQIFGTLDVMKAEVQPRALEHLIKVPTGHVDFNGDRITLQQLKIGLDGQEATANGELRLDGVSPKDIELSLRGSLSPKLLGWVWPDQIGDARGRLDVDLTATGNPRRPQLRGRLDAASVVVELRRLDRELAVDKGSILFTPDGGIQLGCPKTSAPINGKTACTTLTGLFDSESPFTLDGRLVWDGEELRNIDVGLDLLRFAHATSSYSVVVSPKLRLTGGSRALALAGRLDIVEGRWTQDYNITDYLFRPRTVERSVPFWEGVPLLEDMTLQLAMQSTPGTVIVKNNIAELSLSAYLDISGTLKDIRLDGAIQVEEGGQFKIPIVRGDYVTNRGQVTFDHLKPLEDSGNIDMTATADILDRNDISHTIIMTLTGNLKNAVPVWKAQEGWDRSTTYAFIFTGRTPDDLRKTLVGNEPTVRYSGSSGSSGADGLAKNASGVLLSNVLSGPVQRTIGLDIASIEVGTKSVDIRLCKRFGRWIKVCGTGEIGFLGSSRLDARSELRLLDNLQLMLRVEYLTRGVETLQDTQTRAKFELNYRLPGF